MTYTKKRGLTLTEIKVTMAILGIIAAFTVPKIKSVNENRQVNSLIKDSFTVIGEAYLARKLNKSYLAENIGVNERSEFGKYLYDHLDYVSADNPASVANYATEKAAGYFVLPGGVKITKISDINNVSPTVDRLEIKIDVPGLSPPYILAIRTKFDGSTEGEERYTTKFGAIGGAINCNPADITLNVRGSSCP